METVNETHKGTLGRLFGSVQIVSDMNCVTPSEDWSQVRSPGRAARRRKKHPQRIRIYYKPAAYIIDDRIIAHPTIIAELRKAADHGK